MQRTVGLLLPLVALALAPVADSAAGIGAAASGPAPETVRAALRLVLDDAGARATMRLWVECTRDGRLPLLVVYGRGVGIWEGKRQFVVAPDAVRTLIEALRDGGVPCGQFNFPPEALNDPQLLDNGFIVEVEHPLFGPYKTFGPVIQMEKTPTRIRSSAPLLDEHTDEVLGSLGFSESEVARLRTSGVVGAGPALD